MFPLVTYTCDADKEWKDDQKNLKPVDPKCLPGKHYCIITNHKNIIQIQYVLYIFVKKNYMYFMERFLVNTLIICVNCIIISECGRPLVGLARHKRVLGGHLAPQRAFPWHSFIENLHRGGGVVIAEKWILTAANVVMNKNQVVDPKQTKVSKIT